MSSIWHSEPCAYSFRHLESSSFILLAFRIISPQPCHSESRLLTFIFTGIAHLTFMVLRSSLVFPHLVTLCLSLIHHALLDFPFHYTWHSLLSSRHIFRSCCWASNSWRSHVVHIGQSPLSAFFPILKGGSTITYLWHQFSSHLWRNLK